MEPSSPPKTSRFLPPSSAIDVDKLTAEFERLRVPNSRARAVETAATVQELTLFGMLPDDMRNLFADFLESDDDKKKLKASSSYYAKRMPKLDKAIPGTLVTGKVLKDLGEKDLTAYCNLLEDIATLFRADEWTVSRVMGLCIPSSVKATYHYTAFPEIDPKDAVYFNDANQPEKQYPLPAVQAGFGFGAPVAPRPRGTIPEIGLVEDLENLPYDEVSTRYQSIMAALFQGTGKPIPDFSFLDLVPSLPLHARNFFRAYMESFVVYWTAMFTHLKLWAGQLGTVYAATKSVGKLSRELTWSTAVLSRTYLDELAEQLPLAPMDDDLVKRAERILSRLNRRFSDASSSLRKQFTSAYFGFHTTEHSFDTSQLKLSREKVGDYYRKLAYEYLMANPPAYRSGHWDNWGNDSSLLNLGRACQRYLFAMRVFAPMGFDIPRSFQATANWSWKSILFGEETPEKGQVEYIPKWWTKHGYLANLMDTDIGSALLAFHEFQRQEKLATEKRGDMKVEQVKQASKFRSLFFDVQIYHFDERRDEVYKELNDLDGWNISQRDLWIVQQKAVKLLKRWYEEKKETMSRFDQEAVIKHIEKLEKMTELKPLIQPPARRTRASKTSGSSSSTTTKPENVEPEDEWADLE